MRKRDKTCAKATPEEPKREQRMVCLMSEEEQRIVDRYLEKYKITNKSVFDNSRTTAGIPPRIQ